MKNSSSQIQIDLIQLPGEFDLLPPEVIKLDRDYFPCPWTVRGWDDLASGPTSHLLVVAKSQGNIIGFALFMLLPWESLAHLLKIVLIPAELRKGIGRKMMHSAIERLSGAAFEKCFLDVRVDNDNAVSFYSSLGFKIIHTKQSFYSDGSSAYSMLLSI